MLLQVCTFAGDDVITCSVYKVAVCRHILSDKTGDLITAVSVMFAAHFVFNKTYSPQTVATLEYIQRQVEAD